jgi:uncharacterized protein (DUF302 family)
MVEHAGHAVRGDHLDLIRMLPCRLAVYESCTEQRWRVAVTDL